MNLEEQVISFELAKRLCELGVKQDSLFYWRDYKSEAADRPIVVYVPDAYQETLHHTYDYYSAYTTSELGEMLPSTIDNGKYKLEFIKNSDSAFLLAYVEHDDLPPLKYIIGHPEANARAMIIIYLIENGYME